MLTTTYLPTYLPTYFTYWNTKKPTYISYPPQKRDGSMVGPWNSTVSHPTRLFNYSTKILTKQTTKNLPKPHHHTHPVTPKTPLHHQSPPHTVPSWHDATNHLIRFFHKYIRVTHSGYTKHIQPTKIQNHLRSPKLPTYREKEKKHASTYYLYSTTDCSYRKNTTTPTTTPTLSYTPPFLLFSSLHNHLAVYTTTASPIIYRSTIRKTPTHHHPGWVYII